MMVIKTGLNSLCDEWMYAYIRNKTKKNEKNFFLSSTSRRTFFFQTISNLSINSINNRGDHVSMFETRKIKFEEEKKQKLRLFSVAKERKTNVWGAIKSLAGKQTKKKTKRIHS